MKLIFKFSTLIVAIFLISCNNHKNKIDKNKRPLGNYSAKIDSLIQTTNPRLFNGVISITKNGKPMYVKEYGYSNFKTKDPISRNDKFRIMSNTKQVTAVLILKEVEKGNINLQNSISEYLPDFNQTWANKVTVHQLLNMSSGIIAVDKPLQFEPGKGYRYSNPGYGLLGKILESVTGREYSQMANDLFKELGMDNSYVYELNKTNIELTNGYWLLDGEVNLVKFDSLGFDDEEWKTFIPAGGIVSNIHDLTIWDTELHKGEILSPSYQEQMVTASNTGPHAAFNNDTIGYGYGVRIHNTHPVNHLGHGGRGFGFVSLKFYIPEKEVNVIVWENVYWRDGESMPGDKVYYFENEIRKIVLNSNLVKNN
ncbi:serine hydrolase domain-containing protein [Lacinutrix chionoecetis]